MDKTDIWAIVGIFVTIVFTLMAVKKLKFWGNDIEVGGNVGGDVFIGKNKKKINIKR